jgi:glycosyltransferase involved in cell wall biosynthesis
MNILLSSHVFHPNVGGIESSSLAFAHEFVKLGHQVTVITQSKALEPDAFPFLVVRQPDPWILFQLVQECDIFFHNNISLQVAWPLALIRRPWVITHQTWLATPEGKRYWQGELKKKAIRWAKNISISQAVADSLGEIPSCIIGNPYRDDIFQQIPGIQRLRDLVFLGRLVSDKGIDILLQALSLLKKRAVTPHLTIIGSGPEAEPLARLAEELTVSDQVTFVGALSGAELVHSLNAHRILVVPSRWAEPFGIVALEGIACGCVVVGSEAGGLKDAIGPCGLTFPNGNSEALADCLLTLLADPKRLVAYQELAPDHLAHFKARTVAKAYLDIMQEEISCPAHRS